MKHRQPPHDGQGHDRSSDGIRMDIWQAWRDRPLKQNHRTMTALGKRCGLKEEAPIDKRGCEISIRLPLDDHPGVDQIITDVKVRHLDVELVRRSSEVQQAGLAF